jgi:hypothetical protein
MSKPTVDQEEVRLGLRAQLETLHPRAHSADAIRRRFLGPPSAPSVGRSVALAVASLALCVAVGGVALASHVRSTQRPATASSTPLASPIAHGSPGPIVSRASAEATFRNNTANVRRLDSVRAKEMHVSDLVGATSLFSDRSWSGEGNRMIWVVVMTGDFVSDESVPNGAAPPHFSSAEAILGADNGATPIGSLHAGNDTPGWFDALPDIGPP